MTAWLFQIRLPFSNDWNTVEVLRTGVRSCLRAVYPSETYCDSVAMAMSELLENAVKYGSWSSPAVAGAAYVSLQGTADLLTVEVAHPADSAASLEALFKLLHTLQSASSAEEAYVERMQYVAGRTDGSMGGLGLARICYEAGCTLQAEFHGRRLHLFAQSRPPAWGVDPTSVKALAE